MSARAANGSPSDSNTQRSISATLSSGSLRWKYACRSRASGASMRRPLVLAATITGNKSAKYEGSVLASKLKIMGVDVFSAGEINDRLDAIPGVQAVSLSAGAKPMEGDSQIPIWLEGQAKPSTFAEMKFALSYFVQPDYLKVMRIPLERGRFITPDDNEHSPFVIVVDDQFARLFFGNHNPIGQRVNLDILNTKAEIVGVAGHVKQFGLAGDATSPIQSQCYFSVYQIPDKFMSMAADVGIAVRTAGTPPAQVGAIRHALNQINGDLVIYRPQTMGGIISDSLAERRFSMILLGTFATLALFMSCVGIYGVISHLATQRTHEIGIRMALGAERRDVLRMVLGEGAKMTLLGGGAIWMDGPLFACSSAARGA